MPKTDGKDELRDKLMRYLKRAGPAFKGIEVLESRGEIVRDTALRYHSDAVHFFESGDYVSSFAALEYAEGWLDAGVAMGAVSKKALRKAIKRKNFNQIGTDEG